MVGLRWLVAALATIAAGWMLFDGIHAFVGGDYLTPPSGAYAGQLGPWSQLVSAIGIDPRGTPMKTVFVAVGAAWLVVIAAFVARRPWAWTAMMVASIATLWNLVIGTVISVIVIVLLLVPAVRHSVDQS